MVPMMMVVPWWRSSSHSSVSALAVVVAVAVVVIIVVMTVTVLWDLCFVGLVVVASTGNVSSN